MKRLITYLKKLQSTSDSIEKPKNWKLHYSIGSLLPHLENFAEENPEFTMAIPSAKDLGENSLDMYYSYPNFDKISEEKLSKVKIRFNPSIQEGVPIMTVYLKQKLDDVSFEKLAKDIESHAEVGNMILSSAFVVKYEYPFHCNHNVHFKEMYNLIYKSIYGRLPKFKKVNPIKDEE